jgi:hypothetical protein
VRPLRAAALYTVLTVALTWPLAVRLRIMDAGDSAFFAWVMAWELRALTTSPGTLPHAPIFHPLRYTLGYDEPVLGTTVLIAPAALATDDAVLLMNLARLLTFVASALAAYLLARDLGCSEGPALLAGAAFAFSPIRTDQIAHLSTLGTQWLPPLLLFMHRFFRSGRLRDGLLAALFFVLVTLACGYHGLIGLAVLPPAALVLMWGRWGRLPAALLAALLAAVALLPLYALHRAALAPLDYVRGPEETQFYSAAVESFLATSSWNVLYGEVTAPFRTTRANNLFPGLVLPALAIAGGILLWRRRQRPSRDAWALAVLGLGAALVALGPDVYFMGSRLGRGPFGWARDVLPMFQMIRVPSRAGALLALPLAILAAKALTLIQPRRAVVALLDTRRPPPPVYGWLAQQPGAPVVVELPIEDIYGVFRGPAHHESIYLIWQTRHWKPLANGYAGIEPAPYVALREVARRFPSPESLDAFRARGVRYVVLHWKGYGPNKRQRLERELPLAVGLREVARFGEDVVYELE